MCEYCDEIKRIAFDSEISEDEALKQIEIETNKELMLDFLDANEDIGATFESLGLTQEDFDNAECYALTDDDLKTEFKASDKFKLTNLYKYESYAYGALGYGKNSRRFCKTVASRTRASAMRYVDILRLNGSNPGFGQGGSNSYSVFLYRGGSNCKHFWVKYLFDSEVGNLVKSPIGEQPLQINKGDV